MSSSSIVCLTPFSQGLLAELGEAPSLPRLTDRKPRVPPFPASHSARVSCLHGTVAGFVTAMGSDPDSYTHGAISPACANAFESFCSYLHFLNLTENWTNLDIKGQILLKICDARPKDRHNVSG